MSWFKRLFARAPPPPFQPRQSQHRIAFGLPDEAGPEEAGVHRVDYAVFDSRATGETPPPSSTVGIIHIDFVRVFPHLSWASEIGYDQEYPAGFSYKVLTARFPVPPSQPFASARCGRAPGLLGAPQLGPARPP